MFIWYIFYLVFYDCYVLFILNVFYFIMNLFEKKIYVIYYNVLLWKYIMCIDIFFLSLVIKIFFIY